MPDQVLNIYEGLFESCDELEKDPGKHTIGCADQDLF